MNIDTSRYLVDLIFILIIIYTFIVLYQIRGRLQKIIAMRLYTMEFSLAVIILLFVFMMFIYFKYSLNNIDVSKLSGPDRVKYDDFKMKLGIFKSALINGLAAVFISILALADTFMPSFYVTILVSYYTSIAI